MVSDPVVPLEPADYVSEFNTYLEDLETEISGSNFTVDLTNLTAAIAQFETSAQEFVTLRDQAVAANDTELITAISPEALPRRVACPQGSFISIRSSLLDVILDMLRSPFLVLLRASHSIKMQTWRRSGCRRLALRSWSLLVS